MNYQVKRDLNRVHVLVPCIVLVPWISILDVKVSEEKAVKLTREIQRLEKENQCLR